MSVTDIAEILWNDIRRYLRISASDSGQKKNILTFCEWGINRVSALTGAPFEDFTQKNEAQSLLFDYVRYAYNNALEDFENNFKSQIISLQLYYRTQGVS